MLHVPNVPPNSSHRYMSGNAARQLSAELILFPPRRIPDQVRRSHIYNFGPTFLGQVSDCLTRAQQVGEPGMLAGMLTGAADSALAIHPNPQGLPIDMDLFSTRWTFVLIVTKPYNPSSYVTNQQVVRTIYSGFCEDEPYSRGYGGRERPINTECYLAFTHHTTVNVTQSFDSYGEREQVTTSATVDHAIPDTTLQLTPSSEVLHYLLPEDARRSTVMDEDGMPEMNTGIFSEVRAGTPIKDISAEMVSPRRQLQWITRAIYDGLISTDPLVGHVQPMDTYATGQDRIKAVDNSLVCRPSVLPPDNINPSQPYTIGQLDQMFPLHVLGVSFEEMESRWDVASPHAMSARNVMSSLLADILPGQLAINGLADVAFCYSSYERDQYGVPGIDLPEMVSSMVPMSELSLKFRYQAFLNGLKEFTFPTLLQTGGHFDLMVHCSLGGSSVINLVFKDDNMSNQRGMFETSNLLGGLRTPLIGGGDVLKNNSMNLNQLITGILDTTDSPFQAPVIYGGSSL